MQTKTHPQDYERNYAIVSHPIRLCRACGGYVVPSLADGSIFACLDCKGNEWDWVQESEAAAWRKRFIPKVWTSYIPSPKELARRSYKGLHVPGHLCPRCGLVLTVNEKEYKTTDPNPPYFQRRLTCPNFFITGCNHREDFTAEIKAELDAVVQVDVDF